jgi:hypothetical protein
MNVLHEVRRTTYCICTVSPYRCFLQMEVQLSVENDVTIRISGSPVRTVYMHFVVGPVLDTIQPQAEATSSGMESPETTHTTWYILRWFAYEYYVVGLRQMRYSYEASL